MSAGEVEYVERRSDGAPVWTPDRLPGDKTGRKSRRHYWLCRCDCGKEKTVEESHLKTGHTKSCGCYRKELPSSRRIDLTGRQFGRLKVLEEADNSNRTGEYWKCVCSCGRLIEASKESLCAGKTKSCGCLQAETRKKNMKKRFIL